MKKKPIILLGGGGHCKACIDVIEQEGKYDIIGIIDLASKTGSRILNYEIIGTDDDMPELAGTYEYFFITLGQIFTPDKRIKLFNLLNEINDIELPTIISPYAYVSKHARIGKGTIVMHEAVINADSVIGKNCIINTKALIEHDCIVEDHCHISTGAIVNGTVNVGMGTFIGSGAVTNNNCNVPPRSFIKANSFFGRGI